MNLSEIDWDLNSAGRWPLPIKMSAGILVMLLIMGGWHYQFTYDKEIELDKSTQEVNDALLKYKISWGKVVNLNLYQENYKKIEAALKVMMNLIPTQAEVPSLLVDISKAGLANGLEFELFKPINEIKRDNIIELPNSITVVGEYHQLGDFLSDLAILPRIVNIKDISLVAQKAARKADKKKFRKTNKMTLVMRATLITYQELLSEDDAKEDIFDNSKMVCLQKEGLTIKGCKGPSTVVIPYPDLIAKLKENRSYTIKKNLPVVKDMKDVEPFTYVSIGLRDPFIEISQNTRNNKNAAAATGGIKPDFNRKQEPLEAYALDTLRMVGTVDLKGVLWALIRNNEGAIFRVKVGNYIGKNHGHIISITDKKIELDEIIEESEGVWVANKAAIGLSESKQ